MRTANLLCLGSLLWLWLGGCDPDRSQDAAVDAAATRDAWVADTRGRDASSDASSADNGTADSRAMDSTGPDDAGARPDRAETDLWTPDSTPRVDSGTATDAATVISLPLIGAIRWDAWVSGNDDVNGGNYLMVAPSLYTTYAYRRPLYDGDDGWFNIGVDNHAELVDQEIAQAAAHQLDYWAFVWYPEEVGLSVSLIQGPFNDYMASDLHDQVQFVFIIQAGWAHYGDNWDPKYIDYFVDHFLDPQYLRLAGDRPLVFLFGSDGFTPAELDTLRARTEARGLGAPLYVDVNHVPDPTRTQALSSYGPSGASPGGGKHCFQDQAAKDLENLGPYESLLTVPGLTPVADPRPRDETPDYPLSYGYSVDEPTYSQWERHVELMASWALLAPTATTDPPTMLVYAWNELDEGGAGIMPTVQHGTMYLDAISAIKTGDYPAAFTDTLNGDNCAIQTTGAWTNYGPVAGNWNTDEQITSEAGATAELEWIGSGFTVFGTRGPNRGTMRVELDGVEQDQVSTYSDEWATRQPLYSVSGLPTDLHRLTLIAQGDGQIGVDRVDVPVQRGIAVDDDTTGDGLLQWSYAGAGWQVSRTSWDAFGGTVHWSGEATAYADLRFSGRQVLLYGVVAPEHGQGTVSIDGGPEIAVDFYSATRVGHQLIYSSPRLAPTEHTLRLRPSSGSPVVDVAWVVP